MKIRSAFVSSAEAKESSPKIIPAVSSGLNAFARCKFSAATITERSPFLRIPVRESMKTSSADTLKPGQPA